MLLKSLLVLTTSLVANCQLLGRITYADNSLIQGGATGGGGGGGANIEFNPVPQPILSNPLQQQQQQQLSPVDFQSTAFGQFTPQVQSNFLQPVPFVQQQQSFTAPASTAQSDPFRQFSSPPQFSSAGGPQQFSPAGGQVSFDFRTPQVLQSSFDQSFGIDQQQQQFAQQSFEGQQLQQQSFEGQQFNQQPLERQFNQQSVQQGPQTQRVGPLQQGFEAPRAGPFRQTNQGPSQGQPLTQTLQVPLDRFQQQPRFQQPPQQQQSQFQQPPQQQQPRFQQPPQNQQSQFQQPTQQQQPRFQQPPQQQQPQFQQPTQQQQPRFQQPPQQQQPQFEQPLQTQQRPTPPPLPRLAIPVQAYVPTPSPPPSAIPPPPLPPRPVPSQEAPTVEYLYFPGPSSTPEPNTFLDSPRNAHHYPTFAAVNTFQSNRQPFAIGQQQQQQTIGAQFASGQQQQTIGGPITRTMNRTPQNSIFRTSFSGDNRQFGSGLLSRPSADIVPPFSGTTSVTGLRSEVRPTSSLSVTPLQQPSSSIAPRPPPRVIQSGPYFTQTVYPSGTTGGGGAQSQRRPSSPSSSSSSFANNPINIPSSALVAPFQLTGQQIPQQSSSQQFLPQLPEQSFRSFSPLQQSQGQSYRTFSDSTAVSHVKFSGLGVSYEY